MSEDALVLRPAARSLDYVERLLRENDLPVDDVHTHPDCFYVASNQTGCVGIGAIQPALPNGLLRSVVVAEAARGQGLGAALCQALEQVAVADGIDTLYLLTTTAADFFADQGYEVVARDEVPPGIAETEQFAQLCPASATVMRKRL